MFLQAWLNGSQDQKEPLDVSFVMRTLVLPLGLGPETQPRSLLVDPMDVPPSYIRIVAPPKQRSPQEQASAQAKAVYPAAVHYHTTLGLTWEEALVQARKLWQQAGPAIIDRVQNDEHQEPLPDDDLAPLPAM